MKYTRSNEHANNNQTKAKKKKLNNSEQEKLFYEMFTNVQQWRKKIFHVHHLYIKKTHLTNNSRNIYKKKNHSHMYVFVFLFIF